MPKDSEQKLIIYWNTRKIISLICAVLIIPTLIVFLFSFTLKKTVINPNFYKGNLKKVDAYNRLIQEGIPSLILESNLNNKALNDPLVKALIVGVLQKSIDPAWVENLTNKTIDQLVVFFKSPHEAGQNLSLNLKDAKIYLTKASDGLLILEQIIPSCAQTQNGAIDCQKMSVNLDQIKLGIEDLRQKITNIKVGTVNIQKEVNELNASLLFIQKFITSVNDFYYASLIILLVLIGLISVLEYKNLTFMLKAISLPLAIGSLIGLLIMWPIRQLSVNNFEVLNLDLPDEMKLIITDILRTNIAGIFHKFSLTAGIILAVFLIAYIVVLILERTNLKLFNRRS